MATKLLPRHHDEFHTREYWDWFFAEKGGAAFEWYGEYSDLAEYCRRELKSDDAVLVIGCGNSDFSSQLYDAGFPNITNIDFSSSVIEEMRSKHATSRPSMKWEVQDMTSMHFTSPYECIFDKGALDALYSTDTPQLALQAVKMFRCIEEALVPGGVYMCVSLAEPFILRSLLQHFSHTYRITIEALTVSRPSPFTPFLISIRKPLNPSDAQGSVHVAFSSYLHPISSDSSACSVEHALSAVAHAQSYSQTRHDLAEIEPGRVRTLHFYDPSNTSQIPRFSVIVVDTAQSRSLSGSRTAAVFLIPRGRESEYHFSTAEGLRDIAQQAKCQRLMAVCFNRPHTFSSDMQVLQDELSPMIMALVPKSFRPENEDIPYMATGEDSAWEALEYGQSEFAGEFVIEEKPCSESGSSSAVMRRLVFMNNQHIIQTECRLTQRRAAKSSGSKNKKKGSNKKNEATDSDNLVIDINTLDGHHCSMLLAMALSDTLITSASRFRSAKVMSDASESPNCLLIGLGGGALVMALQKYLPSLRVDAVELVPELVEIAEKYFGYVPGPLTQTIVADGLMVIRDRSSSAAGDLSCIVLDVDNKEAASSGVSAPPPAFVTKETLTCMHSLLREEGLLVINAAARSSAAIDAIVSDMQSVFGGSIVMIRGSAEATNVTLVGVKGETPYVRETKSLTKRLDKVLDKWLDIVGMAADPLELRDLISTVEIRA